MLVDTTPLKNIVKQQPILKHFDFDILNHEPCSDRLPANFFKLGSVLIQEKCSF